MNGAVAAGHQQTANAVAEILREGGNAFDAVIAGFFAACVSETVLASLCGGGFLLARDASGRSRVFDFFTHTPRSKTGRDGCDFYPVMVDFGSAQQEFHVGVGACAVPGAVSGMFSIHRELGRMPMRELVQPAVDLARNGLILNPFQAYLLRLLTPIYTTESALPLFRSAVEPDRLMQAGERFRNPELAEVMETLAIEGDRFFYEGEIGAGLVEKCERGGHLTRSDLENYQTFDRQPLALDYKGRRFLTNPPPSAGGVLICFGLELLRHIDLGPGEFGSALHLRALVDVLRSTSAARFGHFDDGPSTSLLDAELVARYRAEVMRAVQAYRGTTHISVVDEKGNIAAMTVSNGEGCGEMIPNTGIMMNNMLGEEDLNPAGFHNWTPNQRMSSMMAPSILLDKERGATALGSGGSNRIRTALLQVVCNMVDFGQDIERAIRAPRIHIETEVLNVENDFPQGTVDALISEFKDHRLFDERSMFFGGVHAVQVGAAGAKAVGDPRRDGVGLSP